MMRIFRKAIFFGLLLSLLLSVGCKQEDDICVLYDWGITPIDMSELTDLPEELHPVMRNIQWGKYEARLLGGIDELKLLLNAAKEAPEQFPDFPIWECVASFDEIAIPSNVPHELELYQIKIESISSGDELIYYYRGIMPVLDKEGNPAGTEQCEVEYHFWNTRQHRGGVAYNSFLEFAKHNRYQLNEDGVVYFEGVNSIDFDLPHTPGIGAIEILVKQKDGIFPYEKLLSMCEVTYFTVGGDPAAEPTGEGGAS